MTVFFDTSALVKLYVPEEHHAKVRAITGERIIASIARVEFASALWRKHRSGELAASDAATLERAVIADLDQRPRRFSIIPATPNVLHLAVDAVRNHGLRAYDAVQLASAIAARAALNQLNDFAVFDSRLRDAAATEGFRVVPTKIG